MITRIALIPCSSEASLRSFHQAYKRGVDWLISGLPFRWFSPAGRLAPTGKAGQIAAYASLPPRQGRRALPPGGWPGSRCRARVGTLGWAGALRAVPPGAVALSDRHGVGGRCSGRAAARSLGHALPGSPGRAGRGGAGGDPCRRGAGLLAESVAGMRGAAPGRDDARRAPVASADAAIEAMRRTHIPDPRAAAVHGGDEPAVRPGVRGLARQVSGAAKEDAAMSSDGDRLPGDPSPEESVARMIRVDHAGEYGAARIYAGQLAVLGRGDKGDVLRHMQAQEQVHLDTFSDLIGRRRVRPTALLPLWHV